MSPSEAALASRHENGKTRLDTSRIVPRSVRLFEHDLSVPDEVPPTQFDLGLGDLVE